MRPGPVPKKKITSLKELSKVIAANLRKKKEMERSLKMFVTAQPPTATKNENETEFY